MSAPAPRRVSAEARPNSAPATPSPRLDTAPVLAVRDLAVRFRTPAGDRDAVRGVSMTVYPGQTLAVVGESGSGKSVTALSVLRLVAPTASVRGRVLFRSPKAQADTVPVDLMTLSERELRRFRGNEIAMIFQEPMTSLNPVQTVGDQIAEAVMLHQGLGARAAWSAAVAAMIQVGIHDAQARATSYPHEFSGGMRQRVMIAMALSCRPTLLLADEPTTALDVTVASQILGLLRELRRSAGLSVVLITHDMGVVAQNADVVCVMYAGRVVEYAPAAELFARPVHPYTRGLLRCVPRLGARTERLTTVPEIISQDGAFDLGLGLRAWWPGHDAPAGTAADGEGADCCLARVSADHWAAVWRTPEAAALASPPDSAAVS